MSDNPEGISEFAAMWSQLTPIQKRFCIAMQEYPTKKEAAEEIGISPLTAYNWPKIVNDVVDFMANNIALATLGILQANATKAAMIKAHGLDSDNEKIRQDVATEILDRNLGKATQRQEVTGADGQPMQTVGMTLAEWKSEQAKRRAEAESKTGDTLDIFEGE